MNLTRSKLVIAFGPKMPGVGSWDWVGQDLVEELGKYYQTIAFGIKDAVRADLVVLVKQPPSAAWVEATARHCPVLFCPVDLYGSTAEIDADAPILRRCARIVTHSERLRKYFEPYASVAYLDHHVKFVAPLRQAFRPEGFFLWVGVHTNLAPLVAWINDHPLPGELRVLMNFEVPGRVPTPAEVGLRGGQKVVIAEWTPQRQAEWTAAARAALDVKANDFRSRHKPPAKAIDYLASGLPLGLGPGHSAVEHLAGMGFQAASLTDSRRWLSQDYWKDVQRFGGALRELFSRERIGWRFKCIIDDVLSQRRLN